MMPPFLEVSPEWLGKYRERGMNPDFWGEPMNALTNAAFLIAAVLALDLAVARRATGPGTMALVFLAGLIGLGSFLFHTIPNRFTLWGDVGPIAAFQASMLWLVMRHLLSLSHPLCTVVTLGVIGLSLVLMQFSQILNGSLFYLPVLMSMLICGVLVSRTDHAEPFLILAAAGCLALAVTLRSLDWSVHWRFGTHFLWHILGGVVVYLALRSWIVFVAPEGRSKE